MSDQWHYAKPGGKQNGPVPAAELKQLAASGQLSPTDLVWKSGMSAWVTASSIKGLFNSDPAPINPAVADPVAVSMRSRRRRNDEDDDDYTQPRDRDSRSPNRARRRRNDDDGEDDDHSFRTDRHADTQESILYQVKNCNRNLTVIGILLMVQLFFWIWLLIQIMRILK